MKNQVDNKKQYKMFYITIILGSNQQQKATISSVEMNVRQKRIKLGQYERIFKILDKKKNYKLKCKTIQNLKKLNKRP